MRILVCGGRDLIDSPDVYSALADTIMPEDTVIHGGARGADSIAGEFASGLGCDVTVYRANWKRDGKAAGAIRNARMLDEGKPDVVLAFPGGRGTADMVAKARSAGVRVLFAVIGDQGALGTMIPPRVMP